LTGHQDKDQHPQPHERKDTQPALHIQIEPGVDEDQDWGDQQKGIHQPAAPDVAFRAIPEEFAAGAPIVGDLIGRSVHTHRRWRGSDDQNLPHPPEGTHHHTQKKIFVGCFEDPPHDSE
jgi:hypothetical protein